MSSEPTPSCNTNGWRNHNGYCKKTIVVLNHHKFKLLKNKHILVTAKKYFIGIDISLIKSGRFRTI